MTRLLVTGIILATLLAASAASAADRPIRKAPPPPAAPLFSWTGCYIGGNAGGAWAQQDAWTDPVIAEDLNQAQATKELRSEGVVAGVHLGCNYQLGVFVIGVEGDWQWTDLSDERSFPNLFADGQPAASGIVSFSHDVKWLASLRGRLGITTSPMALLYVTGGLAWTRSNYTGFDVFEGGCPNCGRVTFDSTHTGFVVGGGLEYAAWTNVILRAEYLFYQFGDAGGTAFFQDDPAAVAAIFNFDSFHVHTARVGVSFLFGGFATPVRAAY